jgi:hypothetical protein
MLKYVNSTIYYPHGNGHAKLTNEVISTLITKQVSDNKEIGMNIFSL